MPMEIRGSYENDHLNRVQDRRQEKVDKAAKDRENEGKPENIPIPKDEYISSVKSVYKPSGLYHMGKDENGNPKVLYDDPEKANKGKKADSTGEPENSAEKTTTNTDKVDRETKKLKEEKKQLEQQLKAAADDEEKTKELEEKIAQVENELSQKDNDTYRRQNAVVS